MTDLFQNPDGANYQARSVLAYLSARSGIEESWSSEWKRYLAEPQVDRWHNCREQGYVVTLRAENSEQINIAFFEHRNSDIICAVEFQGWFLNPPTIDDIPEDHPFAHSKWDVNHQVGYGQPAEMADWIFERLTKFWVANSKSNPAT